jgi:hypothetical protein
VAVSGILRRDLSPEAFLARLAGVPASGVNPQGISPA